MSIIEFPQLISPLKSRDLRLASPASGGVDGLVELARFAMRLCDVPTALMGLPVTQAAVEQEAADDPAPGVSAKGEGATPFETILVVEDEKPLRCIIELVLKQRGYTVLVAENGQEAQQVWEDHSARIGLVITDIVMPGGVSGIDLAKILRLREPGQKVLFISGYSADLASKELSLESGTAFLQKPFSSEKLANAVRDCIDG